MFSIKWKFEIIVGYFILLFSLISCREISTIQIDHDGISTIRRVISFDDLKNDEVENSNNLDEFNDDLHLENVQRNIVRRDIETINEANLAENQATLTDNGQRSLPSNKKGKNHKKPLRSGKKIQAKFLQKIYQENSKSLLPDNAQIRKVRSVNATDYYAQRKAVMDKFYMRQKEIAAKFAKERNDLDASKNRSTGYWLKKNDTSNVNVTNDNNHRSLELINEQNNPNIVTLHTRDKKPIVGDITIYSTPTTRNCTNASLSGQLPRKSRQDDENDEEDESEEIIDENSISTSVKPNRQNVAESSVDQRWGSCSGTLVYQHNLFLSLKGPSNLDTIFEVVMEGPICITCVEVLRYNRTRARVSLDSGGRGYEYVKLRLKGYENEGFSYIVKIWGVRKTGDDCSRQL